MRVPAGEYLNRVTVQVPTETQDAHGAPVKTWHTYVQRWASIVPISGRETFEAHRYASKVDYRIRMHYTKGVTPKMRVLFGSRIFQVVAVIDRDERHIVTELLCYEEH